MSKAQDEISELMALQREAAELKSRPRKADSTTESAGPEASSEAGNSDPASASAAGATDEVEMSQMEETMRELSESLESAIEEIEDAAKEQPVLVALVAFTLGLVVGQLFSRR